MDDDQVEREVLRVLRESSSPLKALDIAKRIGRNCDKKTVNRVLHSRLKNNGAIVANPGQNPPLWTASSQPPIGGVAANPSGSGGVSTYPQSVPSPDPPRAVGMATGDPLPMPSIITSEVLYTKKEERSGQISFIPVGHQSPPQILSLIHI